MKVLMLGWELPPFNSGGLGEACWGLCKSLSQKGVEITFVIPRKVNINSSFMKILFADVDEELSLTSVYLEFGESYLKDIKIDAFPPDYIRAAIKYSERILKFLKRVEADVIHAHDWLTFPAAIVAKEVLKKPLIVHVHSTEFDRTGGNYPNTFVYQIEKDGFKKADVIVVVGAILKKTLVENYGVNPEKIRVVHNGIDAKENSFLPPAFTSFKKMGYKIVLFLGRITLQKGPEYFVRAAKRVLDYYPKAMFVVTGSGDMYEFMVNEATKLGVLKNFIFTGFLRGEDKERIYKSSDIFVMPSVSEPFGITALEAVSNGTPVLISKQSGVSEVLQHALKADFWDIEEIANKILAVLNYEALPIDLKRESSKEVCNLTWKKAADKVISIYNEFLS